MHPGVNEASAMIHGIHQGRVHAVPCGSGINKNGSLPE